MLRWLRRRCWGAAGINLETAPSHSTLTELAADPAPCVQAPPPWPEDSDLAFWDRNGDPLGVRQSCHIYNGEAEIDATLEILRDLAQAHA
ncbi:MAG TPA: hypothetical protein VG206_25560 [Terriglobia bacterium]|nr:hypothetical protein [Terriglobia bacterium]